MASFDPSPFKASLARLFSSHGVTAADIKLVIGSASVRVTASISIVDAEAASRVLDALAGHTAVTLSNALGMVIERIEVVSYSRPLSAEDDLSSTAKGESTNLMSNTMVVGMTAGLGALGIALVIALAVLWRKCSTMRPIQIAPPAQPLPKHQLFNPDLKLALPPDKFDQVVFGGLPPSVSRLRPQQMPRCVSGSWPHQGAPWPPAAPQKSGQDPCPSPTMEGSRPSDETDSDGLSILGPAGLAMRDAALLTPCYHQGDGLGDAQQAMRAPRRLPPLRHRPTPVHISCASAGTSSRGSFPASSSIPYHGHGRHPGAREGFQTRLQMPVGNDFRHFCARVAPPTMKMPAGDGYDDVDAHVALQASLEVQASLEAPGNTTPFHPRKDTAE